MNDPTLYIFSGLPASGKTTLSQLMARRLCISYVRVDTIEQALRDLYSVDVQDEGYALSYRIASDILRVGGSVVVDSCNPIEITRRKWEQVALEAGARYVNIEVICSNENEHHKRVETRLSTITGLNLPTWSEVQNREYHIWMAERIVVDTSGISESECINELISKLSENYA